MLQRTREARRIGKAAECHRCTLRRLLQRVAIRPLAEHLHAHGAVTPERVRRVDKRVHAIDRRQVAGRHGGRVAFVRRCTQCEQRVIVANG